MGVIAGSSSALIILYLLAAASILITESAASWFGAGGGAPNQVPILPFPPSIPARLGASASDPSRIHEFTLRHVFHHGTYRDPELHLRLDIPPNQPIWTTSEDGEYQLVVEPLRARGMALQIQRLSNRKIQTLQSFLSAARAGTAPILPPSAWTLDEVLGPNVTDLDTVLSIARMAANAYTKTPGTGEWKDVPGRFNYTNSFGWESDGLRGHIYADETNSTVVIGLKGTTPAVFDGAETTTNDKVNDNLFFSCCCGQGGQYLWRPVCDCMTSAYTCNSTCVVRALKEENRYYKASIELYGNVTEMYPSSDIWLTGHSLGGSTNSLLGLTFGLPVVTFEAPAEALAAARLGLPAPPGSHPSAPQVRKHTGAYHFGHTADPIFMGSCNTATAGCTLGGYAMETVCHTGQVCRYDTVKDFGWRVGIGYHRVQGIIDNVISAYDKPASCEADEECVDCFNWKYFESNGSDTTTSSSSSSSTSVTRTSTCKTPGWWGCLDETTTTDSSTSTSSPMSTTTTATCATYGWFGRCLDESTTTTTLSVSTSLPYTSSTSVALSCETPGFIWGCKDTISGVPTHPITSPPPMPTM